MKIYAFVNKGTDCYINSILQAILTQYKFVNYLYIHRDKIMSQDTSSVVSTGNVKAQLGVKLLKALTIVIYKLYYPEINMSSYTQTEHTAFNNLYRDYDKITMNLETIQPVQIYMEDFRDVVTKNFGENFGPFYGQKDAHEFLNKLADFISCGLIQLGLFTNNQKRFTIMDNLYSGSVYTQIISQECKHSSTKNTYSEYFELDVPINLDEYSKKPLPDGTDIQTYINEHFKDVQLNGDNKWYCEECSKNKNLPLQKNQNQNHYKQAIMKTFVGNTPEVLTVLLKRFDNNGKKIRKKVIVNKNITINSIKGKITYTLHSAIIHYGNTLLSGHYISLVKYFNDEWFLCNDTKINREQEFDISCGLNSSDTYIVFYKKV